MHLVLHLFVYLFLRYHPPSFREMIFILVVVDFVKSPMAASGICTPQMTQCGFKVPILYTLLRFITVVLQDCIQEADMPLVITRSNCHVTNS